MQLKPIEEQVMVLIGASSGIGLETALRFARKGGREPDGTGLRSDGRIAPSQAGGPWGIDPHLLGRSQALLPVP
jgi:hypothetical protein